jgi:uncharacterized protein (TIGR01777 family)
MNVVVAGGTGFLGQALVTRLRAEGHRVQVLTRHATGGSQLVWNPDGGVGSWSQAIDGADAVVNLAGESIAGRRWNASHKTAIRQSRLLATRSLVTAVEAARVRPAVLVSGSAVGYYGLLGDEMVGEDAPAGDDFLADVCRAWESEAQRAAGATRIVLLRTGLVLGPSGGALQPMLLPFRLFVGGPVGSGRQYWSWIHRDDWVSLVIWALNTAAISGPLNATAPTPVPNREFAQTLGRVLRRPSIMPAPGWALRLALGEMADVLLLGGQRVLPVKAQAAGFTFRYVSLEPALREILRT